MNTYWVEYEFSYGCFDSENNEWFSDYSFEAGRFKCLKSDLYKTVVEHVKNDILSGEKIRNLKVRILDKYITTEAEL